MYSLNPRLRHVWTTRARNKVIYGGRSSSKSHDAAGFAVFLASTVKVKILCARRFQNKISESVYALIESKIAASPGAADFELTNNSIRNKRTGSEFLFYGIERSLNEIKSLEGVDILWLEEANYLTEGQCEVIFPTIRKQGSEIWMIFNPDSFTDYVYQNFVVNPPPNTIVQKINWDDNPFLSETMLEVIHEHFRRDPEGARHIYGGEAKMNNDRAVIPYLYVQACIDAHEKLGFEASGSRRIGFDVADDGGDLNSLVFTHGNVTEWLETWAGLENEILKSTSRAWNAALERGASVTFDCIGVGAHVGAKFNELNEGRNHTQRVESDAFNAGAGVPNPDDVYMELAHTDILNKDHFSNAKAFFWEQVATRMRKTYEAVNGIATYPDDEYISISSDCPELEQLAIELSTPMKDVDLNGRFKVESKKDLIKRGIKSPNRADAFIMSHINMDRDGLGVLGQSFGRR
jgi:phage terminase large subunit